MVYNYLLVIKDILRFGGLVYEVYILLNKTYMSYFVHKDLSLASGD